jgi:hypothetical protein
MRGRNWLATGAGLLAALAWMSAAQAMTMEVIGDQIVLSRDVTPGDVERFRATVAASPIPVTTVILRNSPGGDSLTGQRLANEIRTRGLRTAISGNCRSACARIFLGGVDRHFADGYTPETTYVGFHGTYSSVGLSASAHLQREWYVSMTGGKLDDELAKRWIALNNNRGFMYFFNPNRLQRQDKVSILLCRGEEDAKRRFEECEKIAGTDGYAQGIFTSPVIVKVNKPAG